MNDLCTCGHSKRDHIYDEGPCRPGYVCEARCQQYIPDSPERELVHTVTSDDKVGPNLTAMSREKLILLYQLEQAKSRAWQEYADRLERLISGMDA